ncbi:hypothetical protein C0991_011873 [Blastosporella zonata]|nr:hypothetical protein C0991_011873 [Blastosporella zonata]
MDAERLCVLHDLKHPFSTLYARFVVWGQTWPNPICKTIHNVRVFPTRRKRTSCVLELPKGILLDIIRYALGKRDCGWRTELMYYGSVCRAWVHSLDLFFESVQSRHCKDRPSAYSVAQALEQRADRKALLSVFLPTSYRDYYDNGSYVTFSQACVRILSLVSSIKIINLPVAAGSVWDDLVRVLQRLHGVRKCTLKSSLVYRHSAIIRLYSIDDVQMIVGGWKHLRTMRCEHWKQDNTLKTVRPQQYHLKELRLSSGHLTGDQLLRFIPCMPSSTLKRLFLASVSGLTNADLRSLLELVAPTLSVLHIQNTYTPRAASDESYALDATIARMPRIKSVMLDGDYMSPLSIARKGPGLKKGELNLTGAELHGTITLIVHSEFEVVHAQSVVDAVKRTGWKHVMVWWNRKMAWDADTPWDDGMFAKVVPSIQASGVHLRFRFFDRSVRLTPNNFEYKPGWSPMLVDFY